MMNEESGSTSFGIRTSRRAARIASTQVNSVKYHVDNSGFDVILIGRANKAGVSRRTVRNRHQVIHEANIVSFCQ
jgi:hypothetical protein